MFDFLVDYALQLARVLCTCKGKLTLQVVVDRDIVNRLFIVSFRELLRFNVDGLLLAWYYNDTVSRSVEINNKLLTVVDLGLHHIGLRVGRRLRGHGLLVSIRCTGNTCRLQGVSFCRR